MGAITINQTENRITIETEEKSSWWSRFLAVFIIPSPCRRESVCRCSDRGTLHELPRNKGKTLLRLWPTCPLPRCPLRRCAPGYASETQNGTAMSLFARHIGDNQMAPTHKFDNKESNLKMLRTAIKKIIIKNNPLGSSWPSLKGNTVSPCTVLWIKGFFILVSAVSELSQCDDYRIYYTFHSDSESLFRTTTDKHSYCIPSALYPISPRTKKMGGLFNTCFWGVVEGLWLMRVRFLPGRNLLPNVVFMWKWHFSKF